MIQEARLVDAGIYYVIGGVAYLGATTVASRLMGDSA
jgi:hypothetical protein